MEGENVLSFPKIDVKYDKQGLVLLRGSNKDWREDGGKSNGAGKTSCLSLLPIAIAGMTANKRKHDAWARERTKKPAWLRLTVRDDQKRKIEILRGRRPSKIQMWIDGKDESTGMRGVGKNETQGQIESELGYTLHSLLNSVYIDQTIANGFLFGTQKDKMDLVGKLEDLSRYEEAQKLVGADTKLLSEKIAALTKQVDGLRIVIAECRDDLKESRLEEKDASVYLEEMKKAEKKVKRLLDEFQAIDGTKSFYDTLQTDVDATTVDVEQAELKLAELKADAAVRERSLANKKRLQEKGRCGVCGQKVKKDATDLKASESKATQTGKRNRNPRTEHRKAE